MIRSPFTVSSPLSAPGWRSVQFAGLVAVSLCSSCEGGGSGAGGGADGKEEPAALLPSDGTPVLLKMEGEGWNFSATCAPHRPGDYSGIVRDGKITISSPSDGSNLHIETPTGTWEQGSSEPPGTIEPLFFDMEGQGEDSSSESIRMDELCLEIENLSPAGNMTGHIRRGTLTIGHQTPHPLQSGDRFTIIPQH